MLQRCVVLAGVLALVAAATVEHNRPGRFVQAEERDGAHHGSSGGSSYSSPAQTHSAPASSSSSYSSGGGSTDQGNVYYYYYPVDEQGHELAGNGFDVFTSIILPLVILGGLLLALSSLTFTFTGRSMRENTEPGLVEQLHAEVERIFEIYLNTLESESCIQQAVCKAGVYAKSYQHKELIIGMAEPFVPEHMKGNMDLFKTAAKEGFEMKKCKKYKCRAPKIFQN